MKYPLLTRVSGAASWSSLSALGNSRIAKLTVVTPFLGLINFYSPLLQPLVDLFSRDRTQSPLAILDVLHRGGLEFLYFGLLLVGAATALFYVFCPEEIRRSPKVEEYISLRMSISTTTIADLSLKRLLDAVHAASSNFSTPSHEITAETLDAVNGFARRLFDRAEFGKEFEINEQVSSMFMSFTGGVRTDAVLEVMTSRRRVEEAWWSKLLHFGIRRPTDVFHLEFLVANHSKWKYRLLVGSLFTLGVILVLVPTITTSFIVLLS